MSKTHAQSASSITALKACPMLYFLSYVLRLEPTEDQTPLRMGTNWHKCLEILTLEPGGVCPCIIEGESWVPGCSLCGETGILPNDLRESLLRSLNHVYAIKPVSIEAIDWEIEREILWQCALGWHWYYQDDEVETLGREIKFYEALSKTYRRIGFIDRLVRWQGVISIGEYKSTSKPIDSGSAYWAGLSANPQNDMYLIEARRLQKAGELGEYGVPCGGPGISGILYDVWQKPKIKPKMLTQAATKQFIEDGLYCGQEFEVDYAVSQMTILVVNGVGTDLLPGKKEGTFAIRETIQMFGARLQADIQLDPGKFFARKMIPRTDQQLREADDEFHAIARVAHYMTIRDVWYRNEDQCHTKYRCRFFGICNYGLLPSVRDGEIPDGFKLKGT